MFPPAGNPNLSPGFPVEFSSAHRFHGIANLSAQPIISFPVDKLMPTLHFQFGWFWLGIEDIMD